MQTNRIIVPIGVRTGYFEASKLAKKLGGKLPAVPLHHEYLVGSNGRKTLPCYYAAWARELLVYPEKDGKFRKGRDVVDSETGWAVPWNDVVKHIPASELSGKLKSLLIRPEDIDKEGVVVPASIKLLYPSIQVNGGSGKVDEATGVPLAAWPETAEEKRRLWRSDGVGVRPLFRGYGGLSYEDRRDVGADRHPVAPFGVGLELEIPAGNSEGTRAVFAQILSLFEQGKTEIRNMGYYLCAIESSIRRAAGIYEVEL